ncbi:MAG: hypothetical protein QG632_214 [Candidatus Dependentiae bacterium]|nr:hypothetical protein [Candidatus Dependentiae bacterium]
MKKCHIFLLSLISLLSPFYHANPFSRPTWMGGKVTAEDARKEFNELDEKLERLTSIFIQDGLISEATSDHIAYNQAADTAYDSRKHSDRNNAAQQATSRIDSTNATPPAQTDDNSTNTTPEVISSDNSTPHYPESPTKFFAAERRGTTDKKTNEVEKAFDLRSLLNIIEKQQDNLKKYKRLKFKTRMAKLEEDLAEAQQKYGSFDDTQSESGHTLADIASARQTLQTRLSNAFQYNVQIAYTYYKLARRRPTIDTSSPTKSSPQQKEVNNDDKSALKAMYGLVADIYTGSTKRLREHDLKPLTEKILNNAYEGFEIWLAKLKTLCGESKNTATIATPQNPNDPFEVDLLTTPNYYEIPIADVLGTYKDVTAYLVHCAESIKELTKNKKLFPCTAVQNPNKPKQMIDKLDGWPTNLFAVLAAHHDKLFLGGFSIIGTRWLLMQKILKDVADKTSKIVALLNKKDSSTATDDLDMSFNNYTATLTHLCAARTEAPSPGNSGGTPAALAPTNTAMLGFLANQSFYRIWDTTGGKSDATNGAEISDYGKKAKERQETLIEMAKNLSPEDTKTLTSLRLQATIMLANLHARHSSFIAENAIIAIRSKNIADQKQNFVHPEDTRAYLELKVTEIAVYNLIALIKITGQKQLYDKDAHEKMRSGDLNNALPYLFRNLEPLATSHAQMHTTAKLNNEATHGEPEKAAAESLRLLQRANEEITAYDTARNSKPKEKVGLKKLYEAAAAAILAQLLAAVQTAITAAGATAAATLSKLKTKLTPLNRTNWLLSSQLALDNNEAKALFKSSAVKIQLFNRSLLALQSLTLETIKDYHEISDPADTIIGTLRQTKDPSTVDITTSTASMEGAPANTYDITHKTVIFGGAEVKQLTIFGNDNEPTTGVKSIYANPNATTKLRYLVTRQDSQTYLGTALLDGNNQPFPPDASGAITVILDAEKAPSGDAKKYTKAIYPKETGSTVASMLTFSPLAVAAPQGSSIGSVKLYTLTDGIKIYLTQNSQPYQSAEGIYKKNDNSYWVKANNGVFVGSVTTQNDEHKTVMVETEDKSDTNPLQNAGNPLWEKTTTAAAGGTDVRSVPAETDAVDNTTANSGGVDSDAARSPSSHSTD